MVLINIDLPNDLDKKVAHEKIENGYSSKEIMIIKILRKHYENN